MQNSIKFNRNDESHISAALLRDITSRHLYCKYGDLTEELLVLKQKGLKKTEMKKYLFCPICNCELRIGEKIFIVNQFTGNNKIYICSNSNCLAEHEIVEQKNFGCHDLENIPNLTKNASFKKYDLDAWYAKRLAITIQNSDDRALKSAGLL